MRLIDDDVTTDRRSHPHRVRPLRQGHMPKYDTSPLVRTGRSSTGTISAPSSVERATTSSAETSPCDRAERKHFSQIEIIKKKVKPQDIMNCRRQLSAFLRAGIPIIDAIDISGGVANNADAPGAGESSRCARRAFSEAMAGAQRGFPSYYPGIVRSAELSGQLDVVLEQLATTSTVTSRTRGKVKSALMYPMVLLSMTLVPSSCSSGSSCPSSKTSSRSSAPSCRSPRSCSSTSATCSSYWGLVLMAPPSCSSRSYFSCAPRREMPVSLRAADTGVARGRGYALSSASAGSCRNGGAGSHRRCDDRRDRQHRQPCVRQEALDRPSERMLQGEGWRGRSRRPSSSRVVVQMMRVGEETGTLDQQLDIAADYYQGQLGQARTADCAVRAHDHHRHGRRSRVRRSRARLGDVRHLQPGATSSSQCGV